MKGLKFEEFGILIRYTLFEAIVWSPPHMAARLSYFSFYQSRAYNISLYNPYDFNKPNPVMCPDNLNNKCQKQTFTFVID